MKFGVWLRYGVRKKGLTFDGDQSPDLDCAAGFVYHRGHRSILLFFSLAAVNVVNSFFRSHEFNAKVFTPLNFCSYSFYTPISDSGADGGGLLSTDCGFLVQTKFMQRKIYLQVSYILTFLPKIFKLV